MMDWNRLLSAERLGASPGGHTPLESGRSNFHKDHDRIVFCSPFRRMGRKTQVHPMTENDHVHTRLTHSIEVACVGRSLGVLTGEALRGKIPADITPYDLGAIVQAACLAHDIGNPPFGHAGEYAIRDWFRRDEHAYLLQHLNTAERRDLMTYEGNAQGFRIITQLENHRFEGGLRLTHATLGTTMKYPWTSDHASEKGKFSCYQSETAQLIEVASQLGLPELETGRWARHPLSYLMEAADDICYAILDLEDGIEIGMLPYETVEPILMKICGGDHDLLALEVAAAPSSRRKISLLRGKAIDRCVRDVAATFIAQYDRLMDGRYQGDLLNDSPPGMRHGINEAKQLARDRIFNERRKIEIEVGSFTCLDILLDAFCKAAYQQKVSAEMPFRLKRVLDLMEYNAPRKEWGMYETYRRVLDFIGGMTDNYATYLAQQVGGMGR
ncbi:Deoxyguanosinetriphosphate triphosphohydrolase [Andreprevotia sp. IGB-42]|uniref:deoxyguanosinetriphosphate triphosphohydrolase n=1 Tax=Andreprevotia sp. IGB-42 TaxID=2497473 RepID=UPI00135A1B41|nr:deoxyguanosinetriphosphate triphosphohydrolase [Andreprevotia sp. IGB-42]KAF0814008.1 Deoxyguanosinetriphosphate triphosphohydrolase [Andreprevotia sp. IGB-42]